MWLIELMLLLLQKDFTNSFDHTEYRSNYHWQHTWRWLERHVRIVLSLCCVNDRFPICPKDRFRWGRFKRSDLYHRVNPNKYEKLLSPKSNWFRYILLQSCWRALNFWVSQMTQSKYETSEPSRGQAGRGIGIATGIHNQVWKEWGAYVFMVLSVI